MLSKSKGESQLSVNFDFPSTVTDVVVVVVVVLGGGGWGGGSTSVVGLCGPTAAAVCLSACNGRPLTEGGCERINRHTCIARGRASSGTAGLLGRLEVMLFIGGVS